MFGLGNFWDKSTSWFLKILKLLSFYSGNFNIFRNALGEFILNRTSKHVISSKNFTCDMGFSKNIMTLSTFDDRICTKQGVFQGWFPNTSPKTQTHR